MKLISVTIMTYNHEKFISQCLDSVLNQSRLPDEIIVCDDNSDDNNWEIIKRYKEKYGDLLNIKRNANNFGIFKNCSYTRSLASGQVLISLAGDDMLEEGAINSLYKSLKKNNLIDTNKKFIIYTNFNILYPNKKIKLFDNFKYKDKDHISLVIRSLVGFRGFGISRNLILGRTQDHELHNQYPHLSISLDYIMNIEEAILADDIYFEDFVSNFYRVGYGITSDLQNHSFSNMEFLYQLALKRFKKNIQPRDAKFLEYKIHHARLVNKKTAKNLFNYIYFLIKNIFNFINLRYVLFSDLKILLPINIYTKLRTIYWKKNNQ
tara:strand:+ start:33934 stop:34896 length:963 start_codon:yes stop_codon:yes gene_type:complete